MTTWDEEDYAAYDRWWREHWPEEAAGADQWIPVGQARAWADEVLRNEDDRTTRNVVRGLATLCGEDSLATVSDRKLAQICGVSNRGDMKTTLGSLIEAGWLVRQIEGKGRGAKTTYCLMPGDKIRLPVGRPLRRGGRTGWQFQVT